MDLNFKQLDKFSPLLKINLAISVIHDLIGLLLTIATIVGAVYMGFYIYDEVNKNQPVAQQQKGKK